MVLVCCGIASCGGNEAPATDEIAAGAPGAEAVAAPPMAKWARNCALCHVNGEGGAPRAGHRDEWQARLAQGEDAMIEHVITGYNKMPPLGYCMECSREDFRALTRFMAGMP